MSITVQIFICIMFLAPAIKRVSLVFAILVVSDMHYSLILLCVGRVVSRVSGKLCNSRNKKRQDRHDFNVSGLWAKIPLFRVQRHKQTHMNKGAKAKAETPSYPRF